MMVLKSNLFLFAVILVVSCVASENIFQVTSQEWNEYKLKFSKSYQSEEAEETAKLTYGRNLLLISHHNEAFRNGSVSYKLRPNQFTDLTFDEVQANFPLYIPDSCDYDNKPSMFHKFSGASEGTHEWHRSTIHDQGLKCNSGWAYATATALEILRAKVTSTETQTVSAQYLIDCAGRDIACSKETPLTAFSYLKNSKDPIYNEIDYRNTPSTGKGKCVKPNNSLENSFSLYSYMVVEDYDLSLLQDIAKEMCPAVFELNQLSFEFIHYSEGIFTPPENGVPNTHYMTGIGYAKDTKGIEYWKMQNSFGEHWGEKGYMRLSCDDWNPVVARAIIPTALIDNKNVLYY